MSMHVEIPVATDTPLYTQRVILDGVEFTFRFDWNEREGRWYFDLSRDGAVIVAGVKIVPNWPLLRTKKGDIYPKGPILAIDFSSDRGVPPGYEDLGTRVRLIYWSQNG